LLMGGALSDERAGLWLARVTVSSSKSFFFLYILYWQSDIYNLWANVLAGVQWEIGSCTLHRLWMRHFQRSVPHCVKYSGHFRQILLWVWCCNKGCSSGFGWFASLL
jgi:hypothetical protein